MALDMAIFQQTDPEFIWAKSICISGEVIHQNFSSLEKGVLDDRGNKQTDRPTHWDPIALEDPFSSLPEIKIILSTALDILIVASIASL